jgi:uncharacterized OsmC-like protein
MTEILNNVNLEKVSKTIENGKNDKETLKKPVRLEGEWNFDTTKEYQFRTELPYEYGKEIIEIDSPSFLGGTGKRLGPMAYCIAGITSCFIGTFVGIASSQGIKLTKLNVSTSCDVNFSKTFDLSDEPITESIDFEIDVQSENSDKEKLGEILRLAHERCPAMYSMSHVIPVSAQLK